jgi:hypothetical protein
VGAGVAGMKTICIQIGNSDDKLTQKEWNKFVSMTSGLVAEKADAIHFFEASFGWAEWQNACWVFELKEEYLQPFKETLKILREQFKQDTIAWLEGSTEFV